MVNNRSCFINVLRLIDTLQKNSEDNTKCDNTCAKPFLGNAGKAECLNTRPVTFYRCDNTLISVEYSNGCGPNPTSSIFRVESVDDNCVTCRILALAPESSNFHDKFIDTNQTAIINLDCVCAIKCLADTYVNL